MPGDVLEFRTNIEDTTLENVETVIDQLSQINDAKEAREMVDRWNQSQNINFTKAFINCPTEQTILNWPGKDDKCIRREVITIAGETYYLTIQKAGFYISESGDIDLDHPLRHDLTLVPQNICKMQLSTWAEPAQEEIDRVLAA